MPSHKSGQVLLTLETAPPPQDQATPLWSPEEAFMSNSMDVFWGAQCLSLENTE